MISLRSTVKMPGSDWAGSWSRSAERSDDLERNAASAVQSPMYCTAMPEIVRGLASEIESVVHRHRKHACTFYATETRIAIGAAREGIGAPIMMMHHSAAVSESSHIHTEGSSQSGECPFAKVRHGDLSHLFGRRSARPTDQQIRIDGILRPPSRHFLVGRDDESAIDALRPETVLEFEASLRT
jgi:plasmid stabilization system protein ParE